LSSQVSVGQRVTRVQRSAGREGRLAEHGVGREARFALLALPLAVALAALAWAGVPWGTFQFDDFLNVVRDPATTDPAALFERLRHGLRPLTRLSYFADARLFGMRAGGFLTVNLLLHLVTAALVFALARRRTTALAAFLAALVFALQPANAEVVAYVSGRSTGLMTPLLLAGLLLYDRGQRVGAYLFFVLACLAKEVALVFPLLLLVWEGTRGGGTSRRATIRDVSMALLLAGAMVAALLVRDGYQSLASYSIELRPLLDNLLANARAIPIMLSLWVRPWALSADHDFDATDHLAASAAGLAILGAIVGAALALRRRRPLLALALLWPLIALLPTNSLIAKIDLVTEKPLYLAWVAPSIALGAGAAAILSAAHGRIRRYATAALVGVLLCAMAGASLWRASLWRDPVLLWSDATAKAPGKSRCWNNLGMAQLVARRDADAIAAFDRALLLDPGNESARMNLYTARTLCGEDCGSSVSRR
jgi:protein O-mannosyl-transferase